MIPKKLADISIEDLQSLVDSNTQEHRTLEYKAALPNDSDGDKKEFLADISSLANTDGGDLIFGLKETAGILQTDIGTAITSPDQEIARLENIIRDGISPRIGVEIRAIDVGGGRQAIIIRAKASLDAPHRVIFRGYDKFYKRNSNGKYAMDVGELRTTFLQSGELVERIKRFRTVRIADIQAADTPLPLLSSQSFTAIHILPLASFNTSSRIPSTTLLDLKEGRHNSLFVPYRARGWSQRINLDGVLTYTNNAESVARTYTQLYRDGRIEAVDSSSASDRAASVRSILPMYSIEGGIMEYVAKMLQLLALLEFQPPYYVFVSFVGVDGYTVSTPDGYFHLDPEIISEKDLLLPEVVIENSTDNLHHKFRPIFDLIYNAAGISQSLNFDEHDNFNTHS